MGIGTSTSSNTSSQAADASITQQYSGTCEVTCSNSMDNTNVTLINSDVGGNVTVTQTCSANGTCLFNNTMDATADVEFKAANSATAKDAGSWFVGFFNKDVSKNSSYQSIQEQINQMINQKCSVVSSNQMNDTNIFAQNSHIGGDIAIGQQGTANGNCQLNSSMNASAYATGTIDNCATSGKKAKKCGAGKGGSSVWIYLIASVVIIVIIAIILLIYKAYSGSKKKAAAAKSPTAQTSQTPQYQYEYVPQYVPQYVSVPSPGGEQIEMAALPTTPVAPRATFRAPTPSPARAQYVEMTARTPPAPAPSPASPATPASAYQTPRSVFSTPIGTPPAPPGLGPVVSGVQGPL